MPNAGCRGYRQQSQQPLKTHSIMYQMRKRLAIAASILLTLAPCSLKAQQSEKFRPYGFLQLQGGVSTTFTNAKQNKLLSPTFTVGVGAMVIPQLGLRLNLNGWEQKGGFASIEDRYKYKYFNADVDLLLNVCNLFSKQYNRLFDLTLVAGFGVNHVWGNNIGDLPLTRVTENISNIWGDGLSQKSYNGTSFRMGLMADFRLSRHWQLGLEGDMNAMGDDWNAKFLGNQRDWMLTGQLSLTYRFGVGKKAKAKAPEQKPVPAPVTTQSAYTGAARTAPMETAKAAPVKADQGSKAVNETLYYQIRETDVVNKEIIIGKVADWCKRNPTKKVSVEGYADKGTGTPAINQRYAQQRALNVAKALKDKGVPESQIQVFAFGDKVQPFAVNDQNRCVIIVGK